MTRNMWMQTGSMHYSLYDNPVKAEFMRRAIHGTSPLKDGEADRFYASLGLAAGVFEAAFNPRRRGRGEATAHERNAATTRLCFQSAHVRRWRLPARETGMDPHFRDRAGALAADIESAAASSQYKGGAA